MYRGNFLWLLQEFISQQILLYTNRKAHHHGPILQAIVLLGRVKKISHEGSNITFTKLLLEG